MSEHSDDDRRREINEKLKKEQLKEGKRRAGQAINKTPIQQKAPTIYSQKANKETLDQFIKRALSNKQIQEVQILDLSRHKINELSDKVKFYMRMLRQVRTLNLYANKLRVVPLEIGKYPANLQENLF
jgi:hypothetical protein